jgi:hypothetical protein
VKVALNKGHVRDAVHFQDVGSNQAPLTTDQTTGHLRPATWSCAQVDHRHAGTNQPITLLDLQQLVAGTGTVSVFLRHFDVRIVEMFFQPVQASFGTGHGPPQKI